MEKKSKGKNKKPVCTMTVCENEVTGEVVVTYSGCPPGYVERIAGKVATKGVQFVKGAGNDSSVKDD